MKIGGEITPVSRSGSVVEDSKGKRRVILSWMLATLCSYRAGGITVSPVFQRALASTSGGDEMSSRLLTLFSKILSNS